MSIIDFYKHKAKQCDRLAAASDPVQRTRYRDEGALWSDIEQDAAKQERDDGGAKLAHGIKDKPPRVREKNVEPDTPPKGASRLAVQ